MPATAQSLGAWTPALVRIRGRHQETSAVVTLELERPEGFLFVPGQFNMLYVPGVGEVAISLSGDPDPEAPLLHTIKAVGRVTEALCLLQRGDVVGLRGPFGTGWPLREALGQDLVLVGGGVGFPPLRPLVLHALRRRADFGRIWVLAGVRTPPELLFQEQLAQWAEGGQVTVLTSVDRAGPEWTGRVGVVPALLSELELDPSRTVALMCGPEVMMRFTIWDLERRGVSYERIYVSMERNMKCAVGFCGHCQLGAAFVCKDGPVFRFDGLAPLFWRKEV